MSKHYKEIQKIIPQYKPMDCIFCPDSELEVVYNFPGYTLRSTTHHVTFDICYKICKNCGLVFMSPQLAPQCWRKYQYNCTFTVMDGHVDISHYDMTLRGIERNFQEKHIVSTSRVLEVGCGGGHFLYYLRHKYRCSVFGIDVSKRYIDYTQQVLDLPSQVVSIEDFENPPRYYDMIYSRHVIEHLDNPLYVFSKIYNLLKDDGFFIFEIPSVHMSSNSLRDIFSANNFLFSAGTIRNAIFRTGFEIIAKDEGPCLFYILRKSSPQTDYLLSDYQAVRQSLDISIEQYRALTSRVNERLDGLIEHWQKHNSRIAIWGAGEHTTSLLNDFNLSNCDIRFIIDSNKYLWGSEIYGYKVVSPGDIPGSDIDEIIISSGGYEKEIHAQIKNIAEKMVVQTLYETIT